MNGLMKENFDPIIAQVNDNIETLKKKTNESLETNKEIESSLDIISEKLNALKNETSSFPEDIIKSSETISDLMQSKFKETLDNSSANLNSIKDASSELKNKLQNIQEKLKEI